jgi:hypothetical protein
MPKYKCLNCGYQGKKFIFQFDDYDYCFASNEEEPEYIDGAPQWVKDKGYGDAEIGEPVGCPKCHAWGVNNFEIILKTTTKNFEH